MLKIITLIVGYVVLAFYLNLWPFDRYELHKYYKDPQSMAAIFMGGTHAGILDTYISLDDCQIAKIQADKSDEAIGYTNSTFKCKRQ